MGMQHKSTRRVPNISHKKFCKLNIGKNVDAAEFCTIIIRKNGHLTGPQPVSFAGQRGSIKKARHSTTLSRDE
jgi:hypothetical protein